MAKTAAKKTTAKKKTAAKQTGTKQTAGKGAAKRKPAARAKSTKKTDSRALAKKKSFLRGEMAVLLTAFLGLFLFLSNFGLLGTIGSTIEAVEKGLFGLVAYLFPILLLLAVILYVKERGTFLAPLKFTCTLLFAPVLAGLSQLLFGSAQKLAVLEFYRQGAKGTLGGGLCGGLLADVLQGAAGRVGAYLILILLFIIFMVIVTERSFISAARAGAEKTAKAAKVGRERYAEYHEEALERRKARRDEEARDFRMEEALLENGTAQHSKNNFAAAKEEPDAAEIAKQAQIYAGYGRDIIGDDQPGLGEADDMTGHGPVRGIHGSIDTRNASDSRQAAANNGMLQEGAEEGAANALAEAEYDLPVLHIQDFETTEKPGENAGESEADTRYDTQMLPRGGFAFLAGNNIPDSVYEADTVPFDEPKEDVYKSYAHIAEELPGGTDSSSSANAGASANADFNAAHAPVYAHHPGGEAPQEASAAFVSADVNKLNGSRDASQTGNPVSFTAVKGSDAASAQVPSAVQVPLAAEQTETKPEASEPAAQMPVWNEGFAVTEDDDYEGVDSEALTKAADDSARTYVDDHAPLTTAGGRDLFGPSTYEAERILREKSEQGGAPESSTHTAAAQPLSGAANTGALSHEAMTQPGSRKESNEAAKPAPPPYRFPPLDLLKRGPKSAASNEAELRETAVKLQQVLKTFGVGVTVTNVTRGPSVTRYEMAPDIGVKVSRITSLVDDIKLALAAADIRIEAPIPGKSAVGIEVPNKSNSMVYFRDLLESDAFRDARSKLSFCVGRDIQGQPVIGNIAKMPHLLIAGATGSGKSVGINTLIMSLIYKAKPEEVRMIMIDPKVVELSVYDGIPHLLIPVVTDVGKAVSALNWAVAEMNDRYQRFAQTGTRNISGYNEKIMQISPVLPEEERPQKMTQIVIIIDELAELMMSKKNSGEVEANIVRLAQLARAAGIHLVIATQRPSVDVITGLIKANVPSRIAFKTTSGIDSRTILDMVGAETLLGNGDMLYKPVYEKHPLRVQGAFVSDDEVDRVVQFLKKNGGNRYESKIEAAIAQQSAAQQESAFGDASGGSDSGRDEYFADAGRLITEKGKASIGMLQRMYKIGFNRAARVMDQLGEAGVVGEEDGTKPRRVLMTKEEFEAFLEHG